jgi:2-oxo-3-hexenedioate decarboxylase
MIQPLTMIDPDAIAAETFAALGAARSIPPFSSRCPGIGLDDAYRAMGRLRELRVAGGEITVGRKIGFTNRTIWAEYGVYAPMWGYMFHSTVQDLANTDTVPLAQFAEPRIEPEIVFGLACNPTPEMDEAALLGCVDWIAHGFEIVQSVFPDWKFTAPDTVIANGLHGALFIGPRHRADRGTAQWLSTLASFEIDLLRNGLAMDRGRAANVLDGPLSALRHLVGLLARDSVNPPLVAGEIVTTGTLTRAFPIKAGETWGTLPHGIALDGLRIQFS